jgi:hypothetical protein
MLINNTLHIVFMNIIEKISGVQLINATIIQLRLKTGLLAFNFTIVL